MSDRVVTRPRSVMADAHRARPDDWIQVDNEIPAVALGLATALNHEGWAAAIYPERHVGTPTAIFSSVRSPHCLDLRTEAAAARSPVRFIVLVPREVNGGVLSHVGEAADAIVPYDVSVPDLIALLRLALAGAAVIPPYLQDSLTTRAVSVGVDAIDDDGKRTLSLLAEGLSVAAVAAAFAFSEREMGRRISKLYAQLGVTNRSQAIVRAVRDGIV